MKNFFFILNIIILLFFQNVKCLIVIPFRTNKYIPKEKYLFNVTDLINEYLIVNLFTIVEMGNPPQRITSAIVQEENTFTLSSELCKEKKLDSISDFSIVSKKGIDLSSLISFKDLDLLNSNFKNYLNEDKNIGYFFKNISLYNGTYLSSQPMDTSRTNGKVDSKTEIKNITMIIRDYEKGQKLCGRIGIGSPQRLTGGELKLRYMPSFINTLKKENTINEYSFTFKIYYKDEGRFVIGAKPHEYESNNKLYNEERFTTIKSFEPNNVDFPWSIRFDSIFFNDSVGINHIIQNRVKAYLSPNLGFIIGEEGYKKAIINNYFEPLIQKKICYVEKTQMTNFSRTNYLFGTNGIYDVIYCNSSITIFGRNIPRLNFEYKEQNLKFSLTFNDLFQVIDEIYLFMVIFPENYYRVEHSFWYLGLPFYKAYQLVFNYDSKTIGLYVSKNKNEVINENNNKTNNMINEGEENHKGRSIKRTILEIFFGICLVIVAYLIGKKINEQRKKRANELDDDYDYYSNNKKGVNDINEKDETNKNNKSNMEMSSTLVI